MPLQSIFGMLELLIGLPVEEVQLLPDFYCFLQNLLCRGRVFIVENNVFKQKPFAYISLYRSSETVKNSPAPRMEGGKLYRVCIDNQGQHAHLTQIFLDIPEDPFKARTYMEAVAFLKAPFPSLPHPKAFPKYTRAREIFYDLNDNPQALPWTLAILKTALSLPQLDRRLLVILEINFL
jgi:hypothetical protein